MHYSVTSFAPHREYVNWSLAFAFCHSRGTLWFPINDQHLPLSSGSHLLFAYQEYCCYGYVPHFVLCEYVIRHKILSMPDCPLPCFVFVWSFVWVLDILC